MSRGSGHDWIGEIAGWVIYLLVQTFAVLVMVAVPAVFQAAVRLTATGLIQVSRAGRWRLTPGVIMLLSTVVWPTAGLLLVPVVNTHGNVLAALVEIVVVGAVFGLCVGHQAVNLVEEAALLEPTYDTEQMFDVPAGFITEQHPQQTTERTLEELERRFLQDAAQPDPVPQSLVVRERRVVRAR